MPGLECLNDDHGSAAAWAGLCEAWRLIGLRGGLGFDLWDWHIEQLTHPGKVFGAPTVGKESVVPDAMESRGQDVHEESTDELVGVQGHDLLSVASLGSVVLPLEGHAFVVEGDQSAV